jgi:hypothetical protein
MSVTNERIEAKLRFWADTFRARRHHELSAAACMVWATEEIDRLRGEVESLKRESNGFANANAEKLAVVEEADRLARRSDHRTRWGEDGAATVGCDCTHEIRRHTARGCRDCECVGRRL